MCWKVIPVSFDPGPNSVMECKTLNDRCPVLSLTRWLIVFLSVYVRLSLPSEKNAHQGTKNLKGAISKMRESIIEFKSSFGKAQ